MVRRERGKARGARNVLPIECPRTHVQTCYSADSRFYKGNSFPPDDPAPFRSTIAGCQMHPLAACCYGALDMHSVPLSRPLLSVSGHADRPPVESKSPLASMNKLLPLFIALAMAGSTAFAETLTNREGKSIRVLVGELVDGKVRVNAELGGKDIFIEMKTLSDSSQKRVKEISEARTNNVPPPPPADNGESIVASARASFSKATMEKEVDVIWGEALGEMSFTFGLANERRVEIREQVDAMKEATFRRVALPMGVEVIALELHEGIAAKLHFQEVCVTLKNTGKTPVTEIYGEIETFDAAGRLLKTLDRQCLFAADDPSKNLKPGVTLKVPEARGKWIWQGVNGISFDGEKPTTCKVKITKVIHEQGGNK